MAAGFLITRILLVCLYLIELNYSSAVPTARQDGEKKQQANGFGTRRPLHYIRALRQSKIKMQPEDGVKTTQTSLQTKNPSLKPRGFEVLLNVPLHDLLGQNDKTNSDSKGSAHGNHDTNSAPIQNGLKFLGSNIWGKESATGQHGSTNGHGVSNPTLKLSFSLPSQDTTPKPSTRVTESKSGQNGYTDPAKLSASTQSEMRWSPFSQEDAIRAQVQQQMESKWPISSNANFGPKPTRQQAYEHIYTKPVDGALAFSPWNSGQQMSPQWLNQDKPPVEHVWGSKNQVMTKNPPLPIPNHPQSTDFFRGQTTSPRKAYDVNQMVQPDPQKHPFQSPQNFHRGPSRDLFDDRDAVRSQSRQSGVQIQSSYNTPDSDVLNKGSTEDANGGRRNPETSKQSFQLSLSVPFPPKSRDLTEKDDGNLANIKSHHTSSANAHVEPTKQSSSTHTAPNWASNPDPTYERTHWTGQKWPALNLGYGHAQIQQQTFEPIRPEPIRPKPTDGTLAYLTRHPSQFTNPRQVSEDESPSRQRLGFQKPSVRESPWVIQEYPQHADVYHVYSSPPKQGSKAQTLQYHPPQSEMSYSKPTGNRYVQGLAQPYVGSPLTFAGQRSEGPSIARPQRVETGHHYGPFNPYEPPSSSKPSWEEAKPNYESERMQKWQKLTSFPYQHNVQNPASYDAPSSVYPNQHGFSGKVKDGSQLDEKRRIPQLYIDLEGGDDDSGQTYIAAKLTHEDRQPGKKTAEIPLNFQTRVSMKKDSLKDLLKVPSQNRPQSHLRIPCRNDADCSYIPEKQRQTHHFPTEDYYSPYEEERVVYLPPMQQYVSEPSSKPFQNVFGQRQYHGGGTHLQHPTSYK